MILDRIFLENRYPNLLGEVLLDLSDLGIAAIAPDVFAGLDFTLTLLLENNELTELAPDAFVGLSNLRVLGLAKNRLVRIAPGAFNGIGEMVDLNLNMNQIAELEENTFSTAGKTRRLILTSNKITTVSCGALSGLGLLSILMLSGNPITRLAPGCFFPIKKIRFLDLAMTQLTGIEYELFHAEADDVSIFSEKHLSLFGQKKNTLRCLQTSDSSDDYISAMTAKYSDNTFRSALTSVVELNKLSEFRFSVDRHPVTQRLVVLSKYVRREVDLEKYRFHSVQQLRESFHVRSKLAMAATDALRDQLPECFVRHLSEKW